jgi:hypothetical protein
LKHDDVLIVAGVNLVILLPTLRALLLLKPNDVVVVDRRIRTMIPVKNVMLSSRTQVFKRACDGRDGIGEEGQTVPPTNDDTFGSHAQLSGR